MKKKNWILVGVGAMAAVAAVFFIRKNKKDSGNETPPKKAPQLDIENPGTQSEFPVAPGESRVG
jgi:LPXTG-motif cell wall-anchored protein